MIIDIKEICNELNSYFSEVGNFIQNNSDNTNTKPSDYLVGNYRQPFKIPIITDFDVKRVIKKHLNKNKSAAR